MENQHQLFTHAGTPTCKKCGMFGAGLNKPECKGKLTQTDWERFAAAEKIDHRTWTSYALDNPETPIC